MIVVLDTNILVSGLLFGGDPRRLVDAALAGRYMLVTSRHQLDELKRVLDYPKLSRFVENPVRLIRLVADVAEVIEPTIDPPRLCRDPDDDHILAIAVASSAELLVSGDDDVLSVGSVDEFSIVGVAEALTIVGAA